MMRATSPNAIQPRRCCERTVPQTGFCTDGEQWSCKKCRRKWQHVCDEAEGCFWEPVPRKPARKPKARSCPAGHRYTKENTIVTKQQRETKLNGETKVYESKRCRRCTKDLKRVGSQRRRRLGKQETYAQWAARNGRPINGRGATRKILWTEKEDVIVRQLYPASGSRGVAAAIGRTTTAIQLRARKLGVSWTGIGVPA